jgi:hypothetical protein
MRVEPFDDARLNRLPSVAGNGYQRTRRPPPIRRAGEELYADPDRLGAVHASDGGDLAPQRHALAEKFNRASSSAPSRLVADKRMNRRSGRRIKRSEGGYSLYVPVQESLKLELPMRPTSAGWSREALTEFRDWLDREAFIDLRLIVSELVADAVRTGQEADGPIVLRAELRDGHIYVDVRDGAAAYELESRHEDTGACIWVQMPLAGAA